jgi:hypothetical protein
MIEKDKIQWQQQLKQQRQQIWMEGGKKGEN